MYGLDIVLPGVRGLQIPLNCVVCHKCRGVVGVGHNADFEQRLIDIAIEIGPEVGIDVVKHGTLRPNIDARKYKKGAVGRRGIEGGIVGGCLVVSGAGAVALGIATRGEVEPVVG